MPSVRHGLKSLLWAFGDEDNRLALSEFIFARIRHLGLSAR